MKYIQLLKKLRTLLIVLLILLFIGGCSGDDDDLDNPPDTTNTQDTSDPSPTPIPQPIGSVLISYQKLTESAISVELIDFTLNSRPEFEDNVMQAYTQYNVDVYKVIYNTTYLGETVKVSGACIIPATDNIPPIASFHHGTIFLDGDAPSQFSNIFTMSAEFSMNILFASTGFIVSIPDYVGYGESKDINHPYHHADSTAIAALDMLLAVQELCQALDIQYKSEYFLLGYSEGGYATLAVQKEIESNYPEDFSIVAVSAGAGAYDLYKTAHYYVTSDTINYPAYACLLFAGFNEIYGWQMGYNSIFQEPYSDLLEGGLLNGAYTREEIEAQLTTDPTKLFTESFRNGFVEEADGLVKSALMENNLHDGWVPRAPIILYHGTADDAAPFFNSEAASQNFKANGATNVALISLEGGSHATAVIPWLKRTVEWFLSFR